MDLGAQMWQERIVGEERARLMAYARAWAYYYGRHDDTLPVKPQQPNHNVKVNFIRLAVDVAVSFLFGADVRFELAPESKNDTPAEAWLKQVWEANQKMLLLQKLAINGGVCGHGFLKITPGAVWPRIVNLSPEYVTVQTDPDDIDAVWRYVIEYPAVDKDGKQLTIRQEIERMDAGKWSITDKLARGQGKWETLRTAEWPYAWAPVIDCQNLPAPNEYYGQPDVDEDLIELNRSINFLVSNTGRIIYFHGHPKTWGKGFRSEDLRVAVDETLVLESPDAELHNLEMASDLASSLELYNRLKEAWHEVSQTPEVATGKLESTGGLSGVALQILYAPIIKKTEKKQLTYGYLLKELNRRLLEMGGFGAANECEVHWPELIPSDPLAERQVALIDEQLGVSQDTILTRLGFDADSEREKRELDAQDVGEQLLAAFDRNAPVQGPPPITERPQDGRTQGRQNG